MLTVKNLMPVTVLVAFVVVFSVSAGAQWPKFPEAGVPRDEKGNVRMDAPTPRTGDGKPDFSGMWQRAESGPPRGNGRGGRQGEGGGAGRAQGGGQGAAATPAAPAGAAAPAGQPQAPAGGNSNGDTNAAFAPGRGGVQLEPPTERFP